MTEVLVENGRFHLGIKSLIHAMVSTLRMSKKSGKEEFLLYLRLVLLGVAVVGTVGFIIQYIAALLNST